MNLLYSKRSPRQSFGFTLVEIVIAVTISSLIIFWISAFLNHVTESIDNSVSYGNTYTELTKFTEKIRSYRHIYPENLTFTFTGGYDAVVLTNSGRTNGLLIGIVDTTNSGSDALLDPVSNYTTYGKKTLAFSELSTAQMYTVKTAGISALTTIPFPKEFQYSSLNINSFRANSYNSGALVEGQLSIRTSYKETLKGKSTNTIPTDSDLNLTIYF